MDQIRIDPECSIPEKMELFISRVDPRYEEYLKPDCTWKFSSQLNKTVYHLIRSDTRCRAVDYLKDFFRYGIDGWKDEISSDDLLPDPRIREEGAVRQDCYFVIRMMLFKMGDYLSDTEVKGRLTGPAEGDIIEERIASKEVIKFLKYLRYRDIEASVSGDMTGGAALAVDAVEGADVIGYKVNPERSSQAAGLYRAKEIPVCHLRRLLGV